jgi:hypothetical protein
MSGKEPQRIDQGEPDKRKNDSPLEIELSPDLFPLHPSEEGEDADIRRAIWWAYHTARNTRSHEETTALIGQIVEDAQRNIAFGEWEKAAREKLTPEDIEKFGDDIPF